MITDPLGSLSELLGTNQKSLTCIDFQKIHFARQQGGDYTVVYLRPITQRKYFFECLYFKRLQSELTLNPLPAELP